MIGVGFMTLRAGGRYVLAWDVCPAELMTVGENSDLVVDYFTTSF